MTVGEFCNRQVVIARPEEGVTAAARRMRDFHVGTLVVVDEQDGRRRPVGVVTDRDLVMRVLAQEGRAAGATVVGEVMTSKLVTAEEAEDVVDTLKKMRALGVRRMPVVNDSGGLEGIVAFDDLVGLVAEQLSELRSLLEREQTRESGE